MRPDEMDGAKLMRQARVFSPAQPVWSALSSCNRPLGSPLLTPILQSLFARSEMPALVSSPAFWGLGLPHGDRSAVIVIPGMLSTDLELWPLRDWLRRIGYTPFASGIEFNADCPDILTTRIAGTLRNAFRVTGRKVHIIGHSLGGLIALALACGHPEYVKSTITLAAPLHGLSPQPLVNAMVQVVRDHVMVTRRPDVLPGCYTQCCGCSFGRALRRGIPRNLRWTAVYTRTDGVVDWRDCRSGDPSVDCEVANTTHSGLTQNTIVRRIIAERLASASP